MGGLPAAQVGRHIELVRRRVVVIPLQSAQAGHPLGTEGQVGARPHVPTVQIALGEAVADEVNLVSFHKNTIPYYCNAEKEKSLRPNRSNLPLQKVLLAL